MAEVKNTPEAPKRTSSDIEVIVKRASVGDWLHVQRELDMTRAEVTEDIGTMQVALAYFIAKREGPGATVAQFVAMPQEDLTAFLNLAEDEDSPKEA